MLRPFNSSFNNQFGLPYTLGLSLTKPTLTGANIVEPPWSSYARAQIDPLLWTLLSTNRYTNNEIVIFPAANIPANIYYTVPYFVYYDSSGTFISAGSINPVATITQNGTLSFGLGSILLEINYVGYSPDTTNNAYPTVSYPVFTPTFEPAVLGEPILFQRNMRS